MRVDVIVAFAVTLGALVAVTDVYGQGVIPIPGKIEIEQYDSFFDTTPANAGGGCRTDDADLYLNWDPPDAPGGCTLSDTKAGEWIGFTFNVAQSDTYVLSVRHASAGAGGKFHVEIDGNDVTGQLSVPDTGNWGLVSDDTQTRHFPFKRST